MRTRNLGALISCALALSLASAFAAEQTPAWIDRKAPADDPAVAAALKATSAMMSVPEPVMREVGPIFYADNKIDPHETDLILELLDNKTGKVRITTPAGASFDVPPLSPGARDFLALHDIPDLNALWLTGAKQMKALVDVTVLNPRVVPQIELFFGSKIFTSWRASIGVRDETYLRKTIDAAMGQFRLAGPDTERRGRALLYAAIVRVDRANKGAIRDGLYMHLKPPPNPS
jgi:hypothetical protein